MKNILSCILIIVLMIMPLRAYPPIHNSYIRYIVRPSNEKLFNEVWDIILHNAMVPPADTAEAKNLCLRNILKGGISKCLGDRWARYLVDGKLKEEDIQDHIARDFYVARISERIGYIKINDISLLTVVSLYMTIATRWSESERYNFILDLRFNPGGLTLATGSMMWLFADSHDDILMTENFRTVDRITRVSDVSARRLGQTISAGIFRNVNLVVVVNEETASAAELFAAFLGQKGKLIVGKPTFGKGLAQQEFGLSSGDLLRISVAEVLVGDQKIKIHGIGVTPDYIVEAKHALVRDKFVNDLSDATAEQLLHDDPQLQKAFTIIQQHVVDSRSP